MPHSDYGAISMRIALPLPENVVSTAILFRRAWTVKVKNVISVNQAREEYKRHALLSHAFCEIL
jgi:hypothetical protein